MPLTPEEEKELAQLEAELEPKGDLTPEEEAELSQLESELGTLEPKPASDIYPTESFVRGAANSALFGQAPKIAAVTESVAGSLGLVKDKTYEQSLQESEANFAAAEEANPKSSLAGSIAGALVPGTGLLKGAKAAGGIAVKGAKKAGEVSEKLVDKVAKSIGVESAVVKEKLGDLAAMGADSMMGTGVLATAARTGGKLAKSVREAKAGAAAAASKIKEEALVDQIADKIVGKKSTWDFPVLKSRKK